MVLLGDTDIISDTNLVFNLSRFCPDYRKKASCCLSVRPDKDETELSGLSVSLSADVCFRPDSKFTGNISEYNQYVLLTHI